MAASQWQRTWVVARPVSCTLTCYTIGVSEYGFCTWSHGSAHMHLRAVKRWTVKPYFRGTGTLQPVSFGVWHRGVHVRGVHVSEHPCSSAEPSTQNSAGAQASAYAVPIIGHFGLGVPARRVTKRAGSWTVPRRHLLFGVTCYIYIIIWQVPHVPAGYGLCIQCSGSAHMQARRQVTLQNQIVCSMQ